MIADRHTVSTSCVCQLVDVLTSIPIQARNDVRPQGLVLPGPRLALALLSISFHVSKTDTQKLSGPLVPGVKGVLVPACDSSIRDGQQRFPLYATPERHWIQGWTRGVMEPRIVPLGESNARLKRCVTSLFASHSAPLHKVSQRSEVGHETFTS